MAEDAMHSGAALGIDFVVLARSRLQQRAGDHDAAFASLRGAWELFEMVQLHSCKLVIAAPRAFLAWQFTDGDTLAAVGAEMDKIEAIEATPAQQALATLVRAIARHNDEGVWAARDLFASAGRPLDAQDCASCA